MWIVVGWDGELHVLSPRCHEDEFPDGCAKVRVIVTIQWSPYASSITVERLLGLNVGFEFLQPAQFQKGFHKICTVLHFETLACLGGLKT